MGEKQIEQRRKKRRETLMLLSLTELKELCRRANLADVGTKAVLVESLQAKAIRRRNRFSLHDAQLADQVASLNMTEHQDAEEWLKQLGVVEDGVELMLTHEAGELRPQRGRRVKQLEGL